MQVHGSLLQMRALLKGITDKKAPSVGVGFRHDFFHAVLRAAQTACSPAIAAVSLDVCALLLQLPECKGPAEEGNVFSSSMPNAQQENAVSRSRAKEVLRDFSLKLIQQGNSQTISARNSSLVADKLETLRASIMQPALLQSASSCLEEISTASRLQTWTSDNPESLQTESSMQDGRSKMPDLTTHTVAEDFLKGVAEKLKPSQPAEIRLSGEAALRFSGDFEPIWPPT